MARVHSLLELDSKFRNSIITSLRDCDEAYALPQANRSIESGALKNVVLRLSGSHDGLDPNNFSSNWFAGVSVVQVPNDKAEALFATTSQRAAMARKLADTIPSEMASSEVQVGPELDCDELEKDTSPWTAGFDGPGCCVGLYSAQQSRPPEALQAGMSRAYQCYYLVCKAGAGVAAQTFHSRLSAALKSGATLDQAFSEDGNPGAGALRRVASAAQRNRGRILAAAAEALNIFSLDTVGDSCANNAMCRVAIPEIDAVYNSLCSVSALGGGTVWQYAAGCVDASMSQAGCLTSSNVADGFVAFISPDNDHRFTVRNTAYNCLPMCTDRLLTNRAAVMKMVEAHKECRQTGATQAHPDHAWLRSHFAWKSKDFKHSVDLEPPCLWGTHASENFLSEWAREMGVARASAVKLQPELVAVSAMEPGKLRVAGKGL